jgi:hypothetical protein
MGRARSSRVKSSLVAVLSLGSLVLGIGLIGWASMSISAQSVHPVSPVVLVVNHASVTPGPDKPPYLVRPAEGDAVGRTVIVPTDHAVLTLTTCYPFN